MLRSYVYVVVLFTTIFGQNEPEIPNLSVIRTSEDYYCVLVNDTSNSALLWNSATDTTPSTTSLCNLYEKDRCNLGENQHKPWNWFYHTDVSPVLDYRWESFPIHELQSKASEIYQTDKDNNIEISFSLKIEQEVHIFLCDSYTNYYRSTSYGNCYWISFGANNLLRFYIRKCSTGLIPNPGVYPTECRRFEAKIDDPSIIKVNQWNHFTVSKQKNVIQVRKYGEQHPILDYPDNSETVFKPTSVLARNAKPDEFAAYIKIHQVRASALEQASWANIYFGYDTISVGTCVSLFVKTCNECSFEIYDQNTIANEKSDDWYEISLITEINPINSQPKITLKPTVESQHTVKNPYWYISDSIRKCETDIATKAKKNEHSNDKSDCCYALKYPTHTICTNNFKGSTPGDPGCPANTIGKNCLSYDKFIGNDYCHYCKICELLSTGLQCSCAMGYTGSECSESCPQGTYGFACKQKCGGCKGVCYYVDGACECDTNFKGPTCHEATLPVLKNAPNITHAGRTNITLQASMDFEGENQPNMFNIQYKKAQSESWISTNNSYPYEHGDQIATIPGLESNTEYVLRIVLYIQNGDVYDGRFVPEVVFHTTCGDITQAFLTHNVSDSSITLKVDEGNPLFGEICPLNSYRLILKDGKLTEVFNKIFTSQDTIIRLKPYADYTIEIRKANIVVLNFTITTDEARPGQIVDGRLTASSPTSATLEWSAPQGPYSKIKEYHVTIKKIRSVACPSTTVRYDEGGRRDNPVTETNIRITNLSPYSIYEATIWAVAKYPGIEKIIKFNTNASDKPDDTEFPDISLLPMNTKYKISAKWECLNLKGLLEYQVELICLSEWCFNNRTNSDVAQVTSNPFEYYVEVNTYGYTKYNMTQIIFRNHQWNIKNNFTFTTPARQPGSIRDLTVYSKNKTSFSLRWLPPHPPTGIIEAYYIYEYYSTEIGTLDSTFTCKLWPGKICVTVTTERNERYYSIQAKNFNITEKGPYETTGYISLKEEAPEPPLNMSLGWDNDYGLTIHWHHPDKTNGKLKQFMVKVDGKKRRPYEISEEMPTYQTKVQILNNETAKNLNVEVMAKNSAGSSKQLRGMIFSPPKKPIFVDDPFLPVIGNTSFSIKIPRISSVEGDKSYMYIVITDLNNTEDRYKHTMEQKLFNEIQVKSENSWVVGEINLAEIEKDGLTFEVGNDVQNNSKTIDNWIIVNSKLQAGNSFNISIILNNTFKEYVRYKVYTLKCSLVAPPEEPVNYLLALLLIPIILCVLFFFYFRRNRDKMNTSIYASLQQLGISRNRNDVPMNPLIPERIISPQQTPPSNSGVVITPRSKVISPIEETPNVEKKYSKPVKIIDLEKYTKQAIENEEFDKQHGVFPKGQTKPWTHGTKPENKSKNRYTNLAAYDHSRVKLKIINKDPDTDYINANYIEGYKQQNVYIATQGPKVSTLNDFWRMIWQEKSEYIIMIANVVEAGKKKVEKYWPDINDSREFGDIKVEYVSVDVMANYEVRYFNVTCGSEKRKVQQFHFVAWPDHGVPLYAQSLAPFLKKMLTIPQGRAPVVVHCSAGVGRTGSLILCDICLRMAAREGKIDAFYYLYKMREQRVNMVDNVEQYKLVHLVLLQCLVAPQTGVLCDDTMENNIETIISTKIKEEMKYLEDSAWQDEAMRSATFNSDLPIVQAKNRFKTILPDPSSRILLTPYPSSDSTTSYINAVTVDAFLTPSKFIVTQDPLSNTVGDFWRLIDDKQITMIICLNELDLQDKSTCIFYPSSSENSMKPVPYLEVKYTGKEVNSHFKVYNVTMSRIDNQENDLHIKIMHLNSWSYNMLHPENPIGLLMAYEEMNRLGRTSDNILITCHDGARASGLFVSMCFVIDKIKMEQICDVCLAVRTVRHSRKEFIRERDQFSFLYKCGLEYVRQFDMYANFSSQKT